MFVKDNSMSALIDLFLLNETQEKAYQLIRNDFRYIYSLMSYLPENAKNYYTQFMPYFATIVDGAEDWLKSVKESSKLDLPGRSFYPEEERFYSSVRNGIKFWESSYQTNYLALNISFQNHKQYFDGIASPIARLFHLVDVYGVFSTEMAFCGNTLLADVYIPEYDLLHDDNGEFIKAMAIIAGNYTVIFDAMKPYPLHAAKQFYDYDFGGLRKSPIGKSFTNKYVLMCLLCQINFILYCVIDYFENAHSSEIRFAYLLYYYLCGAIEDINDANDTCFTIDKQYCSKDFRNSVAHYKLGISLKPEELVDNDPLFGLTQKYLHVEALALKLFLIETLSRLANQLTKYLKLKPLDPIWSVRD